MWKKLTLLKLSRNGLIEATSFVKVIQEHALGEDCMCGQCLTVFEK
ncbi:9729_t:CDS:2 [Entrophospora sp. SA101]|nr:9729_t:CDS:2 [Entrophospora sp. SA101]